MAPLPNFAHKREPLPSKGGRVWLTFFILGVLVVAVFVGLSLR
jgi:hypothetical protein